LIRRDEANIQCLLIPARRLRIWHLVDDIVPVANLPAGSILAIGYNTGDISMAQDGADEGKKSGNFCYAQHDGDEMTLWKDGELIVLREFEQYMKQKSYRSREYDMGFNVEDRV
jgi:hypothetical protein